jgi:beta-mannosidase
LGWDIAPRIVSSGIWRDVELKVMKDTEIEELYIATVSVDENSAILDVFFKIRTNMVYFEEFKLKFYFCCIKMETNNLSNFRSNL